jgi:hypothetical protein
VIRTFFFIASFRQGLDAHNGAMGAKVATPANYLLTVPMLSDYLEEGLEKMGVSVEDAEEGIL